MNKNHLRKITILLIILNLTTLLIGSFFQTTQAQEIQGSFAGGSGTSEDPYLISDWTELDSVRDDLSASYELVADLDEETDGYEDLASVIANDGDGWEPIGDFEGVFNGQGYIIQDLYIDREDEHRIGLFSSIDGGTIKQLGVEGNVIGAGDSTEDGVGILAGTMFGGLVEEVFTSGSVEANWGVGGLIGPLRGGEVKDSYSTADVEGEESVGGLIGHTWNDPKVYDSYSTGDVTGTVQYYGGFMGRCLHSTEVHNCFYDEETSGQDDAFGQTSGDVHDCEGKSTEEMQDYSTFDEAGWDFEEIWGIKEEETYPFLQWQEPDTYPYPPEESDLTINVTDGGTTNPEPGTYSYEEGTEVTVESIPDEGYEFVEWTGDETGTDETITVTMDEDKEITANFSEYTEEWVDFIDTTVTVPHGEWIDLIDTTVTVPPGELEEWVDFIDTTVTVSHAELEEWVDFIDTTVTVPHGEWIDLIDTYVNVEHVETHPSIEITDVDVRFVEDAGDNYNVYDVEITYQLFQPVEPLLWYDGEYRPDWEVWILLYDDSDVEQYDEIVYFDWFTRFYEYEEFTYTINDIVLEKGGDYTMSANVWTFNYFDGHAKDFIATTHVPLEAIDLLIDVGIVLILFLFPALLMDFSKIHPVLSKYGLVIGLSLGLFIISTVGYLSMSEIMVVLFAIITIYIKGDTSKDILSDVGDVI